MTEENVPENREIIFTVGRVYYEGEHAEHGKVTVLLLLKGMGKRGLGFLFMRVLCDPAHFKIGEEILLFGKEAFTYRLSLKEQLLRAGPSFTQYAAKGASIFSGG